MEETDEQIETSEAEVLNQYKRRTDLVPNLINVTRMQSLIELQARQLAAEL